MAEESNRLFLEEKAGKLAVSWYPAGHLKPEAAGEEIDFVPPLGEEERERLRWYLEDYLVAPFGVWGERGPKIAAELPGWGRGLFEAAFPPGSKAREAYVKAREADSFEVWICSSDPSFLSLPWELLQDPEHATPLGLEAAGVNRTTSAPGAAFQVPSGEHLRVLMVIARPAGERDVGFHMVARPLLSRLRPVSGQVDLEVLRPPTFDALKARLRQAAAEGKPFQVLHFDGHGTFGAPAAGGGEVDPLRYRAQAPEGYLVFEDDNGDAVPVAASRLAPELKDAKVPLLVFNACQSGMLDDATGPEASVATRLLQEGAAAVVAMGYSVYAVAAAEFMAAFYESLFEGRSLSRAVAAGRRQLRTMQQRPSPIGQQPLEDWIVPVHYARRPVAFPGLARQERRGGEDLSAILEMQRQVDKEVATGGLDEDLVEMAGLFFGRDVEMLKLERALRHRRVALIRGPAGSGKTELAKAFGRWLRDSGGLDKADFAIFHSFEPGEPSYKLDAVIDKVGFRIWGSEFARLEREQREEAVLQALRQARILLIWDNFESVHSMPDPSSVTPPLDEEERGRIRRFVERVAQAGEDGKPSKGGIVLTSRHPEPWLGDLVRLELGGLAPQDAAEYADALLAPLSIPTERRKDPAFEELLEHLEGHPLSLRLVLPGLQHSDAATLLAALQGEADLPPGLESGEGRLDSLNASIHYSFQHLPPEAPERLPALLLFERVVDENVLTVLSQVEGVPERFAGISKEDWHRLLEAAAIAGLLTGLGISNYRIHPALPTYLASLWQQQSGAAAAAELEAAWEASIQAHAGFGNWLNQQIKGGRADLAFALLTLQRHTLSATALRALDADRHAEAQSILQPLNELWDARGLPEAEAWTDRCLSRLEGAGGVSPAWDSPSGSLWLFVISASANRRQQAGDLDAAFGSYDRIRRLLEGSDSDHAHGFLAVAYHQLGMVSQDRGDLSSAESWYRKALEIEEELGNRPGMASVYHQLGTVTQARGDLSSAECWYVKSLKISEELGNRPVMASSYHQLGTVSQARGDLSLAESWYRKSLQIFEELENRLKMATVYHQLGLVSQGRGNLSSAESWYRQSLEISEELGNGPARASSYHQLGTVSQLGGDLSSAESWYRKSLEIKEELGNHPLMASSYHQLGAMSQSRGDLSSAESWYRKSLAISEELGNRSNMASTYGQLGLLAEAQGDSFAALEWTVRCVALFPEFPHPMTGPGPRHLSRLTHQLGLGSLDETWRRVTGEPLPEAVRRWVEENPPA